MMLTCREASRLISEGLDKKLSFADRVALRLHLTLCDACTRVKAQFEFMRRALKAYAGRDEDDPRR
jgi:hypothetical protein